MDLSKPATKLSVHPQSAPEKNAKPAPLERFPHETQWCDSLWFQLFWADLTPTKTRFRSPLLKFFSPRKVWRCLVVVLQNVSLSFNPRLFNNFGGLWFCWLWQLDKWIFVGQVLQYDWGVPNLPTSKGFPWKLMYLTQTYTNIILFWGVRSWNIFCRDGVSLAHQSLYAKDSKKSLKYKWDHVRLTQA